MRIHTERAARPGPSSCSARSSPTRQERVDPEGAAEERPERARLELLHVGADDEEAVADEKARRQGEPDASAIRDALRRKNLMASRVPPGAAPVLSEIC